jgi:hypothetical protein
VKPDEPPTDEEAGDDEEPGGRVVIRLTPVEEKCKALRDEANDLLEAVQSLAFGIREELPLNNDEHRIFSELDQARSALEEVAWILDSQGILRDIDKTESDDETTNPPDSDVDL